MKAILHIGTPKTATTHLQAALWDNRAALRDQGIVYPDLLNKAPDHITLFCASHPYLHPFQNEYGIRSKDEIPPFRDILRQQLLAEVRAAPEEATFVMSSENLTGNLHLAEAIRNLHALLSGIFDEIEIVIYLRRQDEALLSMYAEFMRKGFSEQTFDEFIDENLQDDPVVPYINYDRILEKWARVFGRDSLTLRIFEPARFVGGSVLGDFLSLLPPLGRRLRRAISAYQPANVSLSAPALEFLRLIRPVVPFGHMGRVNPERIALMPRIDALPRDPKPVMSHAQSARIMACFAASNENLARLHFPHSDAPLFGTDLRSAEVSNLGQISLAEFKGFCRAVLE